MLLTELIENESFKEPHLGRSSLLSLLYRHASTEQQDALNTAFCILYDQSLVSMLAVCDRE